MSTAPIALKIFFGIVVFIVNSLAGKERGSDSTSVMLRPRLRKAPWLRIEDRRIAAKASNFAQLRECRERPEKLKNAAGARAVKRRRAADMPGASEAI